MTARLVEIGMMFTLAFLMALFVVPTAIASLFGLQWICAGGSLVIGVVAFVMLMRESWIISQGKS